MRIAYESKWATLYHGDCLEVLPTLDPADLLVTDPPYGIEFKSGRYDGHGHGAIAGDEDVSAAVSALQSVRLRRNRHAYVFWSPLVEIPHAAGLGFSRWEPMVWDKGMGMGGSGAWARAHETILFGVRVPSAAARAAGHGRGAARLRRGAVLRYGKKKGAASRRHPTEKPVALLRELIEMSSKHGETVLDPFAGVGSTLVAAIAEGRRGIGIEIEEKYIPIAIERIREAERLADAMAKL